MVDMVIDWLVCHGWRCNSKNGEDKSGGEKREKGEQREVRQHFHLNSFLQRGNLNQFETN
jgi:hypothetical protein